MSEIQRTRSPGPDLKKTFLKILEDRQISVEKQGRVNFRINGIPCILASANSSIRQSTPFSSFFWGITDRYIQEMEEPNSKLILIAGRNFGRRELHRISEYPEISQIDEATRLLEGPPFLEHVFIFDMPWIKELIKDISPTGVRGRLRRNINIMPDKDLKMVIERIEVTGFQVRDDTYFRLDKLSISEGKQREIIQQIESYFPKKETIPYFEKVAQWLIKTTNEETDEEVENFEIGEDETDLDEEGDEEFFDEIDEIDEIIEDDSPLDFSSTSNYVFYQKLSNYILSEDDIQHLKGIDNSFFLYLIHKRIGIDTTIYKPGSQKEIRGFLDEFKFPRMKKDYAIGQQEFLLCPFETKHGKDSIAITSLLDKAKSHQWGCEYDNSVRLNCQQTECKFLDREDFRKCRIEHPNIWMKKGGNYKFTPQHVNHLSENILKGEKVSINSILRLLYQRTDIRTLNKFKSDFNILDESDLQKLFSGKLLTEFIDEWEVPKFSLEFFNTVFLTNIQDLLIKKRQIIIFGPPGTGKTHLAIGLAQDLTKNNPKNYRIVQFHPSYGYEDFVEGISVMNLSNGNNLKYEIIPKVFRQLCEQAKEQENRMEHIILIIDEINRGDLGRIFGELILGLEYRAIPIQTAYMEKPLMIPENLLIIGTMNSVDRSIAIVDFALRRRFQFIRCMPDKTILEKWLEYKNVGNNIKHKILELFENINSKIISEETKLGIHHQIGHVYFFVENLTEMERNWNFMIRPLLEEYLNYNQVAIGEFDEIYRRFGQ